MGQRKIRVIVVMFMFLLRMVASGNLLGLFSRVKMLKTVTLQLQQVKLRTSYVTVSTIQNMNIKWQCVFGWTIVVLGIWMLDSKDPGVEHTQIFGICHVVTSSQVLPMMEVNVP